MSVRYPESERSMRFMVLEGDSDDVTIADRFSGSRHSYSRCQTAREALISMRKHTYDLVLVDEGWSELFDNREFWLACATSEPSPWIVLVSDRTATESYPPWPKAVVDAVISRRQLSPCRLDEVQATLRGQTGRDPGGQKPPAYFGRSYLSEYLDSIAGNARETDLNWTLVLLEMNTESLEADVEPGRRPRLFFTELASTIGSTSILDKKIGQFDRNVFWGIFTSLSVFDKLRTRVASSLIDFDRKLESGNWNDGAFCNAVVQQFTSGDIDLDAVFRNIDRSLNRAAISPGPSVVYHSSG